MQVYFPGGMRTGLVVVTLAMAICLSYVSGANAGDCGVDPTVTVDALAQDVLTGGSVDYIVTINSASDCNVDILVADSNPDFTSTQPDGTPLAVTTGDNTMTLTVTAAGTTKIGDGNTTTLIVNGDGNAADFELTINTTVNNPLMHNSFNLGSSKWSGAGGWGMDSGKYGEFSCATCHGKNTGNIKRVKSSISFPDNSDMPAGAGVKSAAVNFQATTGADSFGDDTGGHASSTRVCEVCHTFDGTGANGVTAHAYTMASDSGHENNTDCISCHLHSTGFAASCSACHGDGGTGQIWPDGIDNNGGRIDYSDDQVGAHDNHILVISQDLFSLDLNGLISDPGSTDKQKTICAFCHPNPGGGGHDADGGFDELVDMQPPGAFEMLTVGDGNHAADIGSNAYNFTTDSCSNLVCHNLTATPSGGNDWNNPPASVDCTLCHTANGGTQRHDTHVGTSGQNCTECHVDNGTFDSGTSGVNHIDGDVELVWSNSGSYEATFGDSSVTYSGDAAYQTGPWGTCASVACHSNSTTPAWDSTGAGCSLCHTDTQTTGAHEFHMVLDGGDYYAETGYNSTTLNYDFGCADCHAGDTHVNGSTVVTTHGFNSGTKSCATADCHSGLDVSNTQQYKPTPAWDTGHLDDGGADRCAGCHDNSPLSGGHEEHQVGFHYDAIYSGVKNFMPNLPGDTPEIGLIPASGGDTDGDGFSDDNDPLLGHGGALGGGFTSTTMTCNVCHNDTVTTSSNDQNPVCAGCHNDTDAPLMGNAAIADKSVHVNGVRDVVFVDEKIRSKAQVRDELMDVPELSNNWVRTNNYKQADGSSFDESPDTLFNMAANYGGWTTADVTRYAGEPEEMVQPERTCLVSCHLWEKGRVDKYPIHWEDNSIHGPQPIMCIDCHTRLPK